MSIVFKVSFFMAERGLPILSGHLFSIFLGISDPLKKPNIKEEQKDLTVVASFIKFVKFRMHEY